MSNPSISVRTISEGTTIQTQVQVFCDVGTTLEVDTDSIQVGSTAGGAPTAALIFSRRAALEQLRDAVNALLDAWADDGEDNRIY
jgi:hypothetical protein